MAAEGTKNYDPRKDGKRFTLKGGPRNGMKVRLYPQNDGWETFNYNGDVYTREGDKTMRYVTTE
jgi:hypothetical protein